MKIVSAAKKTKMISALNATLALLPESVSLSETMRVSYNKRQPRGKHRIVIPRSLIQIVIKENHDPVYMAHPGIKRTYDLISLNDWWPGMRRSVEEYIRGCDSCQWRKEKANPKANQNNKRLYYRRAKLRSFEAGDQVYLYNPAVKPGTSKSFTFHGLARLR